jgi:hypothetical protein
VELYSWRCDGQFGLQDHYRETGMARFMRRDAVAARTRDAMPTSRYRFGQLPVTEKPQLVRTGKKSEKTIALGLHPTAYPLGNSLK